MTIGSSALPSGVYHNNTAVIGNYGYGELLLRGGTLQFITTTTIVNLLIGRNSDAVTDSFGCLRGWGTIAPSGSGATNVRVGLGRGQIIADGEGTARTLDLHSVVSITNYLTNTANGTNGWYAVNKGVARMPRAWFDKTSDAVQRCSGTWQRLAEPDLVNSVGWTITGASSAASYFMVDLYATDREDVNLDKLPSRVSPIGVWKIGDFNGVLSTSSAVPFTTIDLTFRYDQTKVKSGRTVSLYRWNATKSAWEKLEATHDADKHLVSVTGLSAQAVDGYNVGLFAATKAETPGMLFIVR